MECGAHCPEDGSSDGDLDGQHAMRTASARNEFAVTTDDDYRYSLRMPIWLHEGEFSETGLGRPERMGALVRGRLSLPAIRGASSILSGRNTETMDRLSTLLTYFSLRAGIFYTGNICDVHQLKSSSPLKEWVSTHDEHDRPCGPGEEGRHRQGRHPGQQHIAQGACVESMCAGADPGDRSHRYMGG